MPRTVRIGAGLISLALFLDIVGTVRLRGVTTSSMAQLAVLILLFGGLLVGIVYRRNWARLTFAFLFVVALPFSVIAMTRAAGPAPSRVALSVLLAILQGTGLFCLFLRESSTWYHNRDRAA